MATNPIRTAIAAPPGNLLDALQSFVRAQPDIVVEVIATDLDAARQAASQAATAILILDLALGEEQAYQLISWICQVRPALSCIVLADNRPQQQRSLAAGARHALLKGCLDEDLIAALRAGGGTQA